MPSEDITGLSVWSCKGTSLEMKAVTCPLFTLGWCFPCCPPCPHKTLVSWMRVLAMSRGRSAEFSVPALPWPLRCSASGFCPGPLYQPARSCLACLLGSVTQSAWFFGFALDTAPQMVVSYISVRPVSWNTAPLLGFCIFSSCFFW